MSITHGISEIVLIVDDVVESARFYREVVGLRPESEADEEWAWFFAGDGASDGRLALRNGPLLFEEHSPLPEGERWGRVHFALTVHRSDLDESVERVRESGIEVYGPTQLDWMEATSYYFYDPDGNLVEFWSPNPAGTREEERDETG